MSTPDPKQRFTNRVDDYIRYRPRYPDALIPLLVREFGLAAHEVVADVGSGTGILSELFLQFGCTVFGVEPNREMREAGERLMAGHARFRSIDGSAEATTLPAASVDWITAGQAFHWFDVDRARTEFVRILRPGGRVLLIWNNRLEDTPFLQAYERMLHEFGTDYAAVKHQNVESDGRIERFFAPRGFERRQLDNAQTHDWHALCGRTRSASYVPAPGQPGHEALMAALRRVFDAHAEGGLVTFRYDTRLYVGRLARHARPFIEPYGAECPAMNGRRTLN